MARHLLLGSLQVWASTNNARGRAPRVGPIAVTRSSLRKLSKAKLQQELLSKKAPGDGKKDTLITRLLELNAQEDSRMAQLLAELKASDKQREALQSALDTSTAECSRQRLRFYELSEQLPHLQEASRQQQARMQAAAQATAQQKDDAAWVQRMTSEIQALSARITSLLRELVERDGVVAALRMQLRQRQQALEAEGTAQPALVAAGQVEVDTAQPSKQDISPFLTGPDLPNEYSMPSQEVSSKAAELEALWSSSFSPASAATSPAILQLNAPSRQTTGAALSQAGSALRNLQSPGMLLAAAALQGDRLMASIMSQEDCSRFYAASVGILGAALLTATFLS